MKRSAPLLLALALAMPALAHDDHKHGHKHPHQHAHVHGQAELKVAVDGGRLDLRLESPLEAVLGFEHAPRNDKERAAVASLRKTLAVGEQLFAPTTAAGCKLAETRVISDVLDGKPGAGEDGHGDVVAEYRFACAQPDKLTGLEARLFSNFPKLRRLDVQVVSGKGQTARRLTPRMRLLSW
ncbi:MAG: DUF2796 domain-containing protein [Betaproteobacteria bacterium]|nr:DUF2796 domain-containing protein [Betaproteobacteria bacterium]